MGSTLGLTLAACAAAGANRSGAAPGSEHEQVEVTPGEDLMQEHGVLERILLVYDEAARRIDAAEPLDPKTIAQAADIVRRFVEDYHEKLEERFVFPRLQRAGQQVELVDVLLQQHRRGRELTDEIIRRADGAASSELARGLRSFVRMYRPHASREETVLLPTFRDVVGGSAYREMGEQFEDEEHERFGRDGFEDFVTRVADIEKMLGIYELASFTP
jgi:hemerythrin-like domain-containing protein